LFLHGIGFKKLRDLKLTKLKIVKAVFGIMEIDSLLIDHIEKGNKRVIDMKDLDLHAVDLILGNFSFMFFLRKPLRLAEVNAFEDKDNLIRLREKLERNGLKVKRLSLC